VCVEFEASVQHAQAGEEAPTACELLSWPLPVGSAHTGGDLLRQRMAAHAFIPACMPLHCLHLLGRPGRHISPPGRGPPQSCARAFNKQLPVVERRRGSLLRSWHIWQCLGSCRRMRVL